MRLGLILAGLCLTMAGPASAGSPVIVELYTSQGCGSCVEANRLVDNLADRDGLLPLTFSVDYLDYLGWRDTFARPEFAKRQRSYAERWETPALIAPQVVIDGRAKARGTEAEAVDALIKEAQRAPRNPPDIRFIGDRVAVGTGPRTTTPADVWLIRYDPRGQDVEVRKGENQGRTLIYRNVVRELVRLGGWKGRAVSFAVPEATAKGLVTLVVVQQSKGGEVLALLNE
jgi:hypothetical protein